MPIKGSLKFVSAVVLFTMVFQFALATTPKLAWADPAEAPRSEVIAKPAWNARVANAVNSACEWTLTRTTSLPRPVQAALNVLGWAIPGFPVIPIAQVLRHPDKVSFTVQMARSGFPINVVGAVMGKALSNHVSDIPNLFITASGLWGGILQPYISYQIVNAARNGVATNKSLSLWQRIKSNWLLTVYTYSSTDVIPKIIVGNKGPEVIAASFAYHMLWATFSEVIRQYVTTPLFYDLFPKDSALKEMKTSTSTAQSLQTYELKREKLQAELNQISQNEGGNASIQIRAKAIRDEILVLRANSFWIKWLRRETEDGQQLSEARLAKFERLRASTQVAVGVTMLTIYNIGKFTLATHGGPLESFFGEHVFTSHPVAHASDFQLDNATIAQAETALGDMIDNGSIDQIEDLTDFAVAED